MSFTVITRFPADPATFQQYAAANREQMARIAEESKGAGCLSHFFTASDHDVIAVDEWETVEQCEQFFANQPEIPDVMRSIGAIGAPETTVYRKLQTGGDF